jgi:hypothetical protein
VISIELFLKKTADPQAQRPFVLHLRKCSPSVGFLANLGLAQIGALLKYDACPNMKYANPTMAEQQKPGAHTWTHPRHVDGLDISPAEDGFIIYRADEDRVHYLNPTAVLILELCTGQNSPDQIVELVKQAYGLAQAPVEEVQEALRQLKTESLLVSSDGLA